jgi:hypothetical protein
LPTLLHRYAPVPDQARVGGDPKSRLDIALLLVELAIRLVNRSLARAAEGGVASLYVIRIARESPLDRQDGTNKSGRRARLLRRCRAHFPTTHWTTLHSR